MQQYNTGRASKTRVQQMHNLFRYRTV